MITLPPFVLIGIPVVMILYLGFVIYFNNPKGMINKAFLMLSLCSVLFGIFNFLYNQPNLDSLALWFLRIHLFFAVWYVFSIFNIFYIFPENKITFSRWYKLLLIFIMFVSSLSLTPLVFKRIVSFSSEGRISYVETDFGIGIFGITVLSIFCYSLIIFIKKTLQKDISRVEKIQRFLVLFGLIISLSLQIIFNYIFPNFLNNPKYTIFGIVFLTPFVFFASFAIIRHTLLNIRIIITDLFILILLALSAVQILSAVSFIEIILRLMIFILIIIFGIFVIRSIRKEIEYREKLEELNRLKSEFLSFASHQVKSPMTNIKGFIDLILDGIYGEINDKIREILTKVKNNINEEIDLVDNLLDLRKIEEGRMEYDFAKFDLLELIKEICDFYKIRALDKGLGLNCKINNESIFVNGDREKLKQVFENLVDNAIKYTNSGFIEIDYEKSDSNVVIKVKDTGIGIKPDLLKNLFGQFIRDPSVKKTIKGTGLGLFIAKEIIKAHKGKIWAESEGEGKGSTFYVELPILKEYNKA
jgi:signal transduction histidine kinase